MPAACNIRTGRVERGRARTAGGSCPPFWLQFCPVSTCSDRQQDNNDLEAFLGNRSWGWMSEKALFHLADKLAFQRGREGMKPRAGTWHTNHHRPLLGFPAAWLLPTAPAEPPILQSPGWLAMGRGKHWDQVDRGGPDQRAPFLKSWDLIL